ncbi:hypothetical protein H4R33_005094 [Dimargaris cristalligena]|uniref:Calcipressin-domain-containing protein n=1 Tax=Dimargaris cristalligena TaxID=215637 RepID=A0A4P9ZVC1_9FUNG|nr:hypothetical protein H4R33_005094 [Dimargaris cristalligena]RKP37544.1 Calcipressin-domain-containing protein [Dimargaris cristalligena]|eukprot:RKP37544.1 Calcipressin-domain-containing protein [Dimargaris cristalligena]
MQPSGPTSSKSPQQAAAEGSTSQTVDFPTPALLVTIKPFTPSLATVLENILTVQFGPLLYFAPLPSFARCLAILSSRDKATAAKDFLTHGHWHLESSSQTRVYYYQIDADDPMCTRKDFLKLPQNERLWLISPPGSPPVDWAQEREDPPNAIHLHDELHAALVDLGNGRYHLNYHEDDDNDAEFLLLQFSFAENRYAEVSNPTIAFPGIVHTIIH